LNKIHLYFRIPPQKDRFFPGDRYLLAIARKFFRKTKTSGVKKVFDNLCKGFDELGINYDINLPFNKIKTNEPVIVLGAGRYALEGYNQPNPVIAGIGLMTHPSEWPSLFTDYPVAKYLQHSEWANNVYTPYYQLTNCRLWPAGIDTNKWQPGLNKKYDILVYNKIRWDKLSKDIELRIPILLKLNELNISYKEITYGQYTEDEYHKLLQTCNAMIFLCEHESQGFACLEALSMNIPVFAWDQGFCLDLNRFKWNHPVIPATSIPFFDERCGMSFKNFEDFENNISSFWQLVNKVDFKPRAYILENLTLKKSAEKMLTIINSVYQ
jgi:glycosyltransferase involved in cell wall biosynthesis